MMRAKGEKHHKVGFGRPPVNTRFSKGRSGNPKGRPPRTSRDSDILELLRAALNQEVTVTDQGERRKITKAEAMVTQLVNKGASGDARAIQMLLTALRSIEARLDSAESERTEEVRTQMMMLERLTVDEQRKLRRLVAKAQGEPAETDAASDKVVAPSAATDEEQARDEK